MQTSHGSTSNCRKGSRCVCDRCSTLCRHVHNALKALVRPLAPPPAPRIRLPLVLDSPEGPVFDHGVLGEYVAATAIAEYLRESSRSAVTVRTLNRIAETATSSAAARSVFGFPRRARHARHAIQVKRAAQSSAWAHHHPQLVRIGVGGREVLVDQRLTAGDLTSHSPRGELLRRSSHSCRHGHAPACTDGDEREIRSLRQPLRGAWAQPVIATPRTPVKPGFWVSRSPLETAHGSAGGAEMWW